MARRASDRDPELDKTPEPAPEPAPGPAPEPAPAVDTLDGGHPNQYVRVKHPTTGDYFTATRAMARRMGATLLPNHDAVDQHGAPLPRKPKES